MNIFEQCKRYTIDPFWLDIFDHCSKGRFPKGMTYNAATGEYTFIYPRHGKAITVIRKLPPRPIAVFRLIREYLHQHGVYSPVEIPKLNIPIFLYNHWDQVRSKAAKEE